MTDHDLRRSDGPGSEVLVQAVLMPAQKREASLLSHQPRPVPSAATQYHLRGKRGSDEYVIGSSVVGRQKQVVGAVDGEVVGYFGLGVMISNRTQLREVRSNKGQVVRLWLREQRARLNRLGVWRVT